MSPAERPSLPAFLVRTRAGRLIVLVTVVGGALVLLPTALGRKKPEAAPGAGEAAGGAPSKGAPGGEPPPSPTGFGETLTLGEKYNALISRYGGDLQSTKAELDLTRKELDLLRTAIGADRSREAQEKKSMAETLRQLKEGLVPPGGASPTREISPGGARPAASAVPGGLRSIELGSPPPKEKRERRTVRIPTASGGRASTLNGVFAPVAGEPSPVRLRFDSAVIGPNQARIPLRDSYLIGKASGDPNGCRVSVQIERFSMVKEKGESIETKALGFVVGDDGLEGIPGSYEWRAWDFVPLAVGTGGLQGISGTLAQTQMTSTITPLGGATNVLSGDSMKLAGYQAMGGASGKLGEIVAERMKEIRPAVSTPAHRKVTVVFLEGVSLEGLELEEIDDAKENDPFRGLDSHRR